jgi:hypothetical protein
MLGLARRRVGAVDKFSGERCKYNIVIIDDKDHALKQAIYEFPKANKNDLSFRHFDTIEGFRAAHMQDIFLELRSLLLDGNQLTIGGRK